MVCTDTKLIVPNLHICTCSCCRPTQFLFSTEPSQLMPCRTVASTCPVVIAFVVYGWVHAQSTTLISHSLQGRGRSQQG